MQADGRCPSSKPKHNKLGIFLKKKKLGISSVRAFKRTRINSTRPSVLPSYPAGHFKSRPHPSLVYVLEPASMISMGQHVTQQRTYAVRRWSAWLGAPPYVTRKEELECVWIDDRSRRAPTAGHRGYVGHRWLDGSTGTIGTATPPGPGPPYVRYPRD